MNAPVGGRLNSAMTGSTPSLSPDPDGLQREKRARTSKPKVKTGCHNCKIKCDEKRPSCTQCIRSRKECSGYPAPPRSARAHEVLAIAPKPLARQPQLAPLAPLAPVRRAIEPTPRRAAKIRERQNTATPPQTPAPAFGSVTIYRPSGDLSLSQDEGLYFQLFQLRTASELSGYFDSVFWTKTVLQACHTESAVRHAVVALGALYKTLEQGSESPPGSPTNLQAPIDNAYRHWEVAVRQYAEAITALVHLNQDQKSHRTCLLAHVLLACFDSFVGDHRQAIRQIQNGLGLLDRFRNERKSGAVSNSHEPVEEELVTMFTRLAIQAKSYDMAFHFPEPYVIQLTSQTADSSVSSPSDVGSPPSQPIGSPIPDRFLSLMEARHAYDKLLEKMLHFTERLFTLTRTSGSNNPMGILPTSIREHGLSFRGQLDHWSRAFEPILCSRTAPAVTHQEKAGIAVLKMFQIMSQILYLMTFSDSEYQFDDFQPQFQMIVDLAREVVGDEERRAAARRCPDTAMCQHRHRHRSQYPGIFLGQAYAAHHIKPSFSADLGIVPPLFVVATKCRNPVTRRQAIQLLSSSSRREGMWDSELSARIGSWIVEIEEGEDDNALVSGTLPVVPRAETNRHTQNPSLLEASGSPNSGSDGSSQFGQKHDGRSSCYKNQTHGIAQTFAAVPENKRVMVRAVDFDLRSRFAKLQVGTRGIVPGSRDIRFRVTQFTW